MRMPTEEPMTRARALHKALLILGGLWTFAGTLPAAIASAVIHAQMGDDAARGEMWMMSVSVLGLLTLGAARVLKLTKRGNFCPHCGKVRCSDFGACERCWELHDAGNLA